MKMTADQLLKIAGIASTDTLRARLNESAGGIESITYVYQQRLGSANAEVYGAGGGDMQWVTDYDTYEEAVSEAGVDPAVVSKSDHARIQSVLDLMVSETSAEANGGDRVRRVSDAGLQAVFDRARNRHNRLFGSGVHATFEPGYDS